jgi:hypothetical protein
MSKQHGLRHHILKLAIGFFVAAVTPCNGVALASEMPAALSAPAIEHIDGGLNHGLQLDQSGVGDAQPPTAGGGPAETDLMLVTRQSCRLSFGNTPL